MTAPENLNDLVDLRLLPAWVKEEHSAPDYSDFRGEDAEPQARDRDRRGRDRSRARRPGPPQERERQQQRRPGKGQRGEKRGEARGATRPRHPERREQRPPREPLQLPIQVRFLPHRGSLENIVAQIKIGTVAYSVFALARLFLERPERYSVRLTGTEEKPLFQLGEDGPVTLDKASLENGVFPLVKDDYYRTETTQGEPPKGNFASVARDRASGTVLGPTSYHAYQPQLRTLYEQRYSRRMSFPDFQRQIEIVTDPAAVEQWKDQARTLTSYTTTREETPETFHNAGDAERHFRRTYLPGLVRTATETVIDGVLSRRLPDHNLRRFVEQRWSQEMRSPSGMMSELVFALREAGLSIFRHRRGMLFVTPVRHKPFQHDPASVSEIVARIIGVVSSAPNGISRKELAEQLVADSPEEEREQRKLLLAADLKWLVREGYVIEFNDGTLELPKVKPPAAPGRKQETAAASDGETAPEAEKTAATEVAAESASVSSQPGDIDAKEEEASPTVSVVLDTQPEEEKPQIKTD